MVVIFQLITYRPNVVLINITSLRGEVLFPPLRSYVPIVYALHNVHILNILHTGC